jgi:hypothetical protein
MSVRYEAVDKDTELNHVTQEVEFYVTEDYAGSVYLDVPFDRILSLADEIRNHSD